MPKTESTMMPLGSRAPSFSLPDTVSGRTLTLDEVAGERATLVMFICNHCPFVKHIVQGIVALARDYGNKGVGIVAISANDVESHPEDSPDNMARFAAENGFTFPYLYDETQEVARAYKAACTPDFFLFDSELACIYRGRFDGARPGSDEPVTGNDLRAALDAVVAGEPVGKLQQPSIGCNIKWKAS